MCRHSGNLLEGIPKYAGANNENAIREILSGLVKSVARPEANVTGVARATDVEMQGKRLKVFKEAVPTLRRVTVLYNARGENPGHAKTLALVQKVASNLGLKLTEKPVKSTDDIDRVLFSISKYRVCSTDEY